MITASHNPAEDNGLKLVDSDGGMLAPELEQSVVEFVRLTPAQVQKWLNDYFTTSAYGKITILRECLL